jgi:hypothetical protein
MTAAVCNTRFSMVGEQARFADARLADQTDDLPTSLLDLGQEGVQSGQFLLAPHKGGQHAFPSW